MASSQHTAVLHEISTQDSRNVTRLLEIFIGYSIVCGTVFKCSEFSIVFSCSFSVFIVLLYSLLTPFSLLYFYLVISLVPSLFSSFALCCCSSYVLFPYIFPRDPSFFYFLFVLVFISRSFLSNVSPLNPAFLWASALSQ
jgi:hypothetical protein